MKTGLVLALAFALLLWRLDHVSTRLSATERERDQWRATAEAYRKDAEAQAENARNCLAGAGGNGTPGHHAPGQPPSAEKGRGGSG